MRLRKSLLATDAEGHEVLITPGDVLSEISDGGPILLSGQRIEDVYLEMGPDEFLGWNVSFRFTPKHKLWTEIVTCDAVKLLKALAGEE